MKHIFVLVLLVSAFSIVLAGANPKASTQKNAQTNTASQKTASSSGNSDDEHPLNWAGKKLKDGFNHSYTWCRDWGLHIYDYTTKSEIAKHQFFQAMYSAALQAGGHAKKCINYAHETSANLANQA